jgi:hypothetical protein
MALKILPEAFANDPDRGGYFRSGEAGGITGLYPGGIWNIAGCGSAVSAIEW